MASKPIHFLITWSLLTCILLTPAVAAVETYRIEITMANKTSSETPDGVKVPVRIDGNHVTDLRVGEVWFMESIVGAKHRVDVSEFVYLTNETRIHFPENSWVVSSHKVDLRKHTFLFEIEDKIRASAHPAELELGGLVRVTERSLEWGIGMTHEPPPKNELFLARGAFIRLLAQPLVVGTPGTEYRFIGFLVSGTIRPGTPSGQFYRAINLSISNPTTFGAIYEKYYLIQIEAKPGVSSEDWHLAGERVALTAQTDIPLNGIIGLLGGKYRFQGWNVDGKLTTNENLSFEVTSPAKIRAEFAEDYSHVWLYTFLFLLATTVILRKALQKTKI